jgi:hypothetical protein
LTSKRNFEARDKAANTAGPTYAFLSRDNKRRDNAREWRASPAASGNIWLRENAWWWMQPASNRSLPPGFPAIREKNRDLSNFAPSWGYDRRRSAMLARLPTKIP